VPGPTGEGRQSACRPLVVHGLRRTLSGGTANKMNDKHRDLRGCATAYDGRDQLPELASWMSEDHLKLLPIWHGTRFTRGHEYFDLDNPDRGAFVATGDEGVPTNWTYVCRDDVPENVWAELITWRQPISGRQAEAIESMARTR